jgi:hypothetical protein
MADLTKGHTFSNGESVTATKLNNLVDLATISNIDNDDISNSAGIVDSKLAQITTASKVGGTALYALNSLPSSAGQIPLPQIPTIPNSSLSVLSLPTLVNGNALFGLANIASGAGLIPATNRLKVKVGETTRDMTAATGTAVITGVGFTPVAIAFFAVVAGSDMKLSSWGFTDLTSHMSIYVYDNSGNKTGLLNTSCITAYDGVANAQTATVSTVGSDGFTISWTKSGTPSAGTLSITYLVIG